MADCLKYGRPESVGVRPGWISDYVNEVERRGLMCHSFAMVRHGQVNMATELLRNTELSVTEIAMKSGFQSIRSFNRVYREFTGNTPGEEMTRMR